MESGKDKFWENFFATAELTPSLDVSLTGDSGLTHRFPAIGTGDTGTDTRMVLVTSEPDPIKAQLVSADIQRKYPSEKVILTRPSVSNTKELVAQLASRMIALYGNGQDEFKFNLEEALSHFDKDRLASEGLLEVSKGTVFENLFRSIHFTSEMLDASIFENVVQLIRECLLLEVHTLFGAKMPEFDFTGLFGRTAYTADVLAGICPIPVFDFTEDDWGKLTTEVDLEFSEQLFRRIGVSQFFRPPLDQTALVLADASQLSASSLEHAVDALETIGHPISAPELVHSQPSIEELIEKLKDEKYVVEGEIEYTLTPEGKTQRSLVKFRPREAVFFRLAKMVPGLAQLISAMR